MMTKIILATLLIIHALLLGYGALVHCPSFDESAHLPAGLSVWSLRRFDVYPHNPPLVRIVAALPTVLAGYQFDWRNLERSPLARPEFLLGSQFVDANGQRSFWLYTFARWACIPFCLLGGYICFRWANDLAGPASGLLACAAWCFCPNILGHGQAITPDVPAAALCLTAGYAFWHWLKAGTWPSALGTGAVLGTAWLAKFTALLMEPALILAWLAAPKRPKLIQLAAIVVTAVYVVNAGFMFQKSFQPLGRIGFHSRILSGQVFGHGDQSQGQNRFAESWLGYVPVPLPEDYVKGIDLQKRDFELGYQSYLAGEWKHGGWWYYYLYALAVKTPVGTLAIWILAAVFAFFRGPPWREQAALLIPSGLIFAVVSSETGFNHHFRYVLPAIPFLFVWSSQMVARGRPWLMAAAWIAMTFSAAESLRVFPHSMSFFNVLVGGPTNGPKHLLDSNLSWGQDLFFLRDWLGEHSEAKPLYMVYFGDFDPRVAGIEFTLPPRAPGSSKATCPAHLDQGPVPGWHAIDINYVYGLNRRVPDGQGGWSNGPSRGCDFTYYKHFEPVARIAYSMFVYHITKEEANEFRRKLGLPEISEAESTTVERSG
jgi:hypothetical protein